MFSALKKLATITAICATTVIATAVSASLPASAEDAQVLEIIKADGNKIDYDMAAIKALPQAKIVTTTAWTTPGQKVTFTGPLLRDLLKKSGMDNIEQLNYFAGNDYSVQIPTKDAMDYDVMIALDQDGKALDPADKGPYWIMYPYSDHPELDDKIGRSKAIWQLTKIVAQ